MRNAIDGMDPSLNLSATLNINAKPIRFAYISKLALVGGNTPVSLQPDPERILLNIGNESALEICSQLSSAHKMYLNVKKLKELSSHFAYEQSNYAVARTERGERRERIPSRYLLREIDDKELARKIELISEGSSSSEETVKGIEALIKSLQEEAINIKSIPLKNKIETFSGEESFIPNYIINLMHAISSIEVLRLTERRKQIGKDEAERLLSLKVQRGGTEVLRNIQETVSALLGVQIDAFRGEKAAELDVDDFLVEVNGSGIREALRLLLDFEFKKPKIFLIEEPEVHLHPALETSVMQYLKKISLNCQVFITTHSTNFLDMGEIKNVYLVSRSESTHVQTLDLEEAQIMIPKELGIRLSSLFMYDRLVFVEGPSDESVIREFASTLGSNFGQSNVGFVHLRGIRNFVSYAAEETLNFLSKRQVKMWFIIDKDERDESEIKSLEEKLKGKATLVALRKREIENYLLFPRAIAEFIKLKSRLSGRKIEPQESEIECALSESMEGLKQFVINKYISKNIYRPIYPSHNLDFMVDEAILSKDINKEIEKMKTHLDSLKENLDKCIQENKAHVESSWESKKLDMVPGDLLLDNVCKIFALRFKKMQDSKRLASLMNETEIDRDIKDLILQINN